MKNIKQLFLISFCVSYLTACGSGTEDSASGADNTDNIDNEIITSVKTADVLADPDATFKMTHDIEYTVSNQSDINITVFIYDGLSHLLARHYLPAGQILDSEIQLPLADQTVTVSWQYREYVKDENLSLAELTFINFSGFDDYELID